MALFSKKCLSYAYYMLTFVDGNLLLYLCRSDYLEYPFFVFALFCDTPHVKLKKDAEVILIKKTSQ